jgi:Predicted hydrolases or acyltransferases (alpha/beta hydrolase superfamily)
MEKTLKYQNKTIFYRDAGQGKPVLLLHGFGETGEVWKNQIPSLQTDFRLIIPDLPGSGRSEAVDDMSMDGLADCVKAVLDDAGLTSGTTSLIGHSMGGYITLAFVEKYQQYLRSFGLFHSTSYADSDEKKEVRRKGIAFVRQHGADEFLKTSIPNLFSPQTKQQNPDLIDEFIRSLHNFSAQAIVSYYEAMMSRPDRTHLLKTTRLPVIFVIGEHDNAVSPGDSLKQAHLPEISYIDLLHQSGHMGMLEEPEKCNQLLNKFLRET